MPEQFDSVTALMGAVFCDEWGEAQPFEVIKQRKVGRCVAVCQSFSRGQRGGGKHMIANGWWLWSCSQTNGKIKRVINTSRHKSKFAPASVYKLPTIKRRTFGIVTPLGDEPTLGVFSSAGRQEQRRAATSLSTLGVCWCQWVPKSEQDDDHGWIVWGRGGWWFRPWSLSRDLCSPQCGLCLPVDNLPGSAAPAKRGNPSSWMSALNLSSLLFFCSVFTAMKIPHSTERLPYFALSESL